MATVLDRETRCYLRAELAGVVAALLVFSVLLAAPMLGRQADRLLSEPGETTMEDAMTIK